MWGVALALGSGLAFSGLDAVRKSLLQRIDPWALLFLLSLGQGTMYALWTTLDGAAWAEIDWGPYLPDLTGLTALQMAANMLFLQALKVGDLSRVVPFLSLTPVLTALAGLGALGESPDGATWIGIGLVTAGTVAVATARVAHGSGSAWRWLLQWDRASLMTLGVATLWSAAAAVDRHALSMVPAAVHALMQSATLTAVTGAVLLFRKDWPSPRTLVDQGPVLGVAMGFGATALGLQLLSMEVLWVSLVETIKRASGALASLLVGRWAFAERIGLRHTVGVILILSGTALVLL